MSHKKRGLKAKTDRSTNRPTNHLCVSINNTLTLTTGHFTLRIEAAWISEMLVSYHITTWHHKSEDLNLKHHCCKSLKTDYIHFSYYDTCKSYSVPSNSLLLYLSSITSHGNSWCGGGYRHSSQQVQWCGFRCWRYRYRHLISSCSQYIFFFSWLPNTITHLSV